VTENDVTWQGDLFTAASTPEPDRSFTTLVKHRLDATAWVDHAPGWLRGADALFADLLQCAPWATEQQELYGKVMDAPRLIARWPYEPGMRELPPALEVLRAVLQDRYERPFDTVNANLYRDGRDSVAWHGDRVGKTLRHPLVCTVSLGNPRRFLMRPRGGPTQLRLTLRSGDLVVMGGSSQHTWQHAIPKVASAGPRISIAFRHSH
jgi:alkylated DNA repair dioxygenase AlkB